jgi:hypothetical protein
MATLWTEVVMPGPVVLVVVVVAVLVWRSVAWRGRAELWVSAVLVPWLTGAGRLSVVGLRRRVTRQLLWEATVTAGEWGRLPEEAAVLLAPDDAQLLSPIRGAVEAGLVADLCLLAERRCWSVPRDLQVMLVEDPGVVIGRPVVSVRIGRADRPTPEPSVTTGACRASRTTTAPQPGTTRKTRPGRSRRSSERRVECELISLDGRGPDIALAGARPVLSVGRVGCDVVVRDEVVSARHAELRRAGPQWLIRDCSSTNGVELNGKGIDGYIPLLHNDEVSFGRGGPRYVFARLGPDAPSREGSRGA